MLRALLLLNVVTIAAGPGSLSLWDDWPGGRFTDLNGIIARGVIILGVGWVLARPQALVTRPPAETSEPGMGG